MEMRRAPMKKHSLQKFLPFLLATVLTGVMA